MRRFHGFARCRRDATVRVWVFDRPNAAAASLGLVPHITDATAAAPEG